MKKNFLITLTLTLTFIRRSFSVVGLTLTLTLSLHAQSTFFKYLDCGLNTCNAKETEITSSGNIAILRVLIEQQQNKIHLTQFTAYGTLLSDWRFEDPAGHRIIFHKFTGTSDHGVILTGNFHPNITSGDACLAKVDSNGTIEWVRKFEGDTELPAEYGRAVFQTSNGEYLMFQSSSNTTFLTRLDAGGNILWSKKIDSLYLNDAVQLNDGSLVTAMTNTSDPLYYKLHALRFDEYGNIQWAQHMKSTKSLEGHKLIQLTDKSFVLDAISISSGDTSKPVIRLDSSGNILWAKTFRPVPSSTKITEIALASISNSEILIGAESYSKNPMFLKVNKEGTIISSKKIIIPYFRMADIAETPDAGFIICGKVRPGNVSSPKACLIKTNANAYAGCKDKPGSFTAKDFRAVSAVPFTLTPYNAINISSFTALSVSKQEEDYSTICSSGLLKEHEPFKTGIAGTISVFPNPFSSTVTIVLPGDELFTVCAYDALGRLILERASLTGAFTWLPPYDGKIFFIHAVNAEGLVHSIKVLRAE